MGLDIIARSKLTFVGADLGDEDIDRSVLIYIDKGDFDRTDGLPNGYYTKSPDTRDESFRVGAYSRYGDWRDGLAQFAFGMSPSEVAERNDRGELQGKPFVELVNFSDCLGSIGPATSLKLARDFALFERDYADRHEEWECELYRSFKKAFAVASNGGFVKFG